MDVDLRWRVWALIVASLVVVAVPAAVFLVPGKTSTELERIRERGAITVLTQNTQHAYYTLRNAPAGFEYELAAAFADYLDVELDVEVRPWSELIPALTEGEGDFIAAAVTDTAERRRRVAFSDPYLIVHQHLIVHASRYGIRRMADMNGMVVHVREGTTYERRLRELIRGGLRAEVVTHADRPTEDLIRAVAEGEIEATVADTHIARLNRRYYPDIRIAFPISGPEPLAWAVRPEDEELRREINDFLETLKDEGRFARIYDRYYGNTEVFDYVDVKTFHRRIQTRLPRYEEVFRREAERHGFDWRFVAAMAYQESHYHPLATSYTGVRGLMQITLATARDLGVENRLDPEESIRGGVAYLDWLYRRFDDIGEERDRLLFALAAYNVGYGHVRDAQLLAREQGLDTGSWQSLEETLPLLSRPEYYRRLPHGYARGQEPVRYVNRILEYYDILRQLEQTERDQTENEPSFEHRPEGS